MFLRKTKDVTGRDDSPEGAANIHQRVQGPRKKLSHLYNWRTELLCNCADAASCFSLFWTGVSTVVILCSSHQCVWSTCLHVGLKITSLYQFSSVAQLCLTHCNSMDCSMLGFPVHHQVPELAQTHVHRVSDAIQPSHPLLSPSPPAFSLSQNQGLFQGVSSLHQVAKVLELQIQHRSFQWVFRTDFL